MLVPLKEQDFDKYIGFAYELALDPARSGYPAYFDGVKTRADFMERARSAFSRPGEEILLYQADGAVEGWIHYYYLAEDRYISTYSCCVRRNTGGALEEFSSYLAARYPGCEWTIGFSAKNREAVQWLEGAGHTRLDDSNHYQLLFSQYTPTPDEPDVERITEENFEKFQRIHQAIEGDMYWNCQRVRRELSRWDLFVAEEDGIAGEIMALDERGGFYEVFALECDDGQFHEGLFRRLLRRVLNEGKRKGATVMPFFVDTDGEENQVLPGFGFQLIGNYRSYSKRI